MKSKFYIVISIVATIAVIIIVSYLIHFVATPNLGIVPMENSSSSENSQNNMEEMNAEEMSGMEQKPNVETISKTVVNYTDSGFNPSSIEIKKGDTVQFVNQSNGKMWVASGPHPTHTIYPEFDAKKSVPNGGIYEFTFTKVGIWSYHNHAVPEKVGMVIVK